MSYYKKKFNETFCEKAWFTNCFQTYHLLDPGTAYLIIPLTRHWSVYVEIPDRLANTKWSVGPDYSIPIYDEEHISHTSIKL